MIDWVRVKPIKIIQPKLVSLAVTVRIESFVHFLRRPWSRLLRLLNESVIRDDTFEDFKAELDKLGRAEDIGKSAPGTLNLLQVACERGLPKHLEVMLKIEGTQVKYKTMT